MPLTISSSNAFGVVGINLTQLFENLASQSKSRQAPIHDDIHIDSNDGKTSLLASSNLYNNAHTESINLALATAPLWVDYSDQAKADIEKAEDTLVKLDALHTERLKVSFGGQETVQEEAINATSSQITRFLKSAETNIKRIALDGTDSGATMTPNEREIRLNVMRQLGSLLHTTMSSFRTKQKEFLTNLQAQQSVGSHDVFDQLSSENEPAITLETLMEEGLTEEEELQLRELEDRADHREKEIIHLVQQINELASLFQELNSLVIEQGTILDRIDYNMESTLTFVQQGNENLVKADEHSKKNIMLKLIFIFLIIIIIEIIVFIIKHSK